MSRRSLRAVQCVAVAAVGALALSGCSSSSTTSHRTVKVAANYAYGSIPAAATSVVPGGTLTVAEDPGADPNWIFPITPAANSSVYDITQFQYLSWRSLYWSPNGSTVAWDYSRSMTDGAPTVSADGKTFTIKLNDKYTWSDGSKVSAQDVLFWFDLYKAAVKESAANSGNYTPGQFPDNVTAATIVNSSTISFTFKTVLNPQWVLGTEFSQIIPLPSKTWAKSSANGPILDYTKPANATAIYNYLSAQSKDLSTYGSNPIWQDVNGPYKITSYNTSTGAADFTANTAYTGQGKPTITNVDLLSYTSQAAEFNDLLAGKLDFGYVNSASIPQIGKLTAKGYHTYGLPDWGFSYIYFNFKDATGNLDKIFSQDYVRQAFAHLQDEPAEIQGVFHGAAAPAYSSVGVSPSSPYTPSDALTDPYPYSVATAKQLLTSHGWKVVPNGSTTCTSPGTAANECGAGIPAGAAISFPLVYANSSPAIEQLVTSYASALKQVGINATLKSDTFNNVISNESVVSTPKNDDNWGMADFGGFTNGIYPSTDNLFNTGGSYNQGGYSNPTLDTLINNSITSTSSTAIQAELSAVATDVPGIFQPNEDRIYAWSPKLSGDPSTFAAATQFNLNPEDWYFTK